MKNFDEIGCDELHSVFFTPREDVKGPHDAVVVQIPETTDSSSSPPWR
jgi:hypothetical protein